MSDQLQGARILVVEDEYYIAADLRRALEGAGATVIGPAATVARGSELVADGDLDAAILDVNLEGEISTPIAELLTARSIPYLLLTGYDKWSLPEEFRTVPQILKPFQVEPVLCALTDLLSGNPLK